MIINITGACGFIYLFRCGMHGFTSHNNCFHKTSTLKNQKISARVGIIVDDRKSTGVVRDIKS